MNLYRFRAECLADVEKLNIKLPSDYRYWRTTPDLPDVEVRFKSALPLETIKWIMSEIEDGHVMAETLNYEHAYVGERITNETIWLQLGFQNLCDN